MKAVRQWFEITFVLVFAYLILSKRRGFSSAVRALSAGYAESVRALQGRP